MLIFVQTGKLCQWTADSQRLILEYFDIINTSPSHIYCSVFKFPPSSSWLHQYYGVGLSQEVKVVRGLPAGWGTCFRIVVSEERPLGLAYWKDTIAIGSESGYIMILNVITGTKIAVLSGHIGLARCFTFSPDGTMLVSGSNDKTIKLWDMQTGGVVKTFQGHTDVVYSVSISPNCTTIASGSGDKTIRLWNIQTGECHCIIQQEHLTGPVCFLPLDSHHIMFVAGCKVQKWNIDGYKIPPEYCCSCAAFSFDGTKLILYNEGVAQIRSSDSGAIIAEFHVERAYTVKCCFSPNGRLVAVSAGHTVYVWDITNPEPCLIETLIGHTGDIISLVFSSPTSLISTSQDKSIRFWQIGTSPISLDLTDPKSTLHTSSIKSITLQAKDGIAISTDSDGVVRIWDLSTGLCKASFHTPAKDFPWRDVQLIGNRLVLAWYAAKVNKWDTTKKIHIWDVKKGELLYTLNAPSVNVYDLRISGDGSKVFYMEHDYIHAWYIWTGKVMGKVRLHSAYSSDSLFTVESSRVWVNEHHTEGWDFGASNSSSIKHYKKPPNRPHLDFTGGIRGKRSYLPGIEDTISGKEVFQLPSRYKRPNDAQWDGQYLVAGYETGEVIILDCNCMLAH